MRTSIATIKPIAHGDVYLKESIIIHDEFHDLLWNNIHEHHGSYGS